MGVTGPGDSAPGFSAATRVLGRDEPCVAHELGRLAEALKSTDLCDDGYRGKLRDTAQGLQRIDDRLLLSRCRFDRAIDRQFESSETLAL